MIRFNTLKRAMAPVLTGSAVALALLVGVAQAAPAGAAQLYPPGPTVAPPVDCGVIIQGIDDCAAAQAGIIVNE
jgi:hypothetical protein